MQRNYNVVKCSNLIGFARVYILYIKATVIVIKVISWWRWTWGVKLYVAARILDSRANVCQECETKTVKWENDKHRYQLCVCVYWKQTMLDYIACRYITCIYIYVYISMCVCVCVCDLCRVWQHTGIMWIIQKPILHFPYMIIRTSHL